jgi:hypothetical protein
VNIWRNRHAFAVLMQQADAGAAGGSAGGDNGGAAVAAGAANGTDAAVDKGAAAGANNGGVAGSVLQNGAAADAGTPTDFIPEKYRVSKDDGTIDLEASARKLAKAHGDAEKRIGSGDIPPKTADEYQVKVPEAFKEAFNPEEDAGYQEFRTKAHAAGMTQAQMDLVMDQYFKMAPQLAAGATQLDAEDASAELKKQWATDADFKRNVRNAYVGANAIATKAGLNIDEIMSPAGLGNNPMFLRLMAAIGPEFQEDAPPGGQEMVSEESITELLSSEAYTNPKHVDHAKVSKQVSEYYRRKHGTERAG